MTETKIKLRVDNQLPLGWRYSRLQDVITEAQPGFACGARSPSGVIQLRMNNVDTRGNFVWDEFVRVPSEVTDLDKYRLEPGDILFNNTNSTELVGKSALFQGHSEPVVYSNHFTRIRINTERSFPVYIIDWLIWQHQLGTFANLCNRWIGQSAVKNDILFSLEIPLPPTRAEQERIARILNEQIAVVEKARAAAEVRLEAAKALQSAYLRAVFESEKAKEWPLIRLREVCHQIDYGYTASADFTLREPRFLRITDIQNGNVIWDMVPGCKINQSEEAAAKLWDRDIVFARTGGTVGKSFLIKDPPRAVFASYLIRLRPEKDTIDPEYLYSFLQSDSYWRQLRMASRGGAQPNVNATLLGNLELPVPSIREQRDILSNLREQMAHIIQLTEVVDKELMAINALPAAFLRRAFTGGL